MVERAKKNGKVTSDSESFVVEGKKSKRMKGKRYEDLYNIALYSAGERQN